MEPGLNPGVRPGRQEIEEVPNNSGIKRNDFRQYIKKKKKSKSMLKFSMMN